MNVVNTVIKTIILLPEVFMTSIIKTLLKINFVYFKITLDNVVVNTKAAPGCVIIFID